MRTADGFRREEHPLWRRLRRIFLRLPGALARRRRARLDDLGRHLLRDVGLGDRDRPPGGGPR